MNEKITSALAESRIYRDYSKAFGTLTGLPLTLRSLKTVPGQSGKQWSCAVLGRPNCACRSCHKGFLRIVGGSSSRGAVIKCTKGCCGAAVPVRSGRDVVALLHVGPVPGRFRFPGLLVIPETEVFKSVDAAVRRERKRDRFVILPLSQRRCRAAVTLLGIFADQLAGLCNQMVVQKQNGEPPLIARAREFIARHYGEDISSRQAARELHVSRCYFCKQFKKSTGLTFTEYVSRLRIERVKELLLNRNLRISEIAFQAGFQSLTHFNRLFLKVTGESPTGYRRRLHTI